MAVTVRRLSRVSAAGLLTASLVSADQAADVLNQISAVATSLSAGNAAEAMDPFDKSLPNYEQLQNELIGLTTAYTLRNEIDVTDEQDAPDETNVTVNWVMTLESTQTNSTDQRSGAIKIRLLRKGKKWKIVNFSPIDLFDPAYKSSKSSL